MAIKQKLIIDKGLSNEYQIIVRDETGHYNNSNPEGYGGTNISPEDISRYIFEIHNLNTGVKYTQIQSDNRISTTDVLLPTVYDISAKENVYLDAEHQNIEKFNIGVYKINMITELKDIEEGEGFINTDVIVNVPGSKIISELFQSVVIDNVVYDIVNYAESTLILDRPLHKDITEFKLAYKISDTFVLYDGLEDCVNSKIANFFDNCNCDINNELNLLSELYLLDWGIKKSIEDSDYAQAKVYLDLAYNVCRISNCGC